MKIPTTKELRTLACRDRKDLPLSLAELKFTSAKDSDSVTFEGYAAVWGRVDAYGDTMLRGAFDAALKARRPIMLYGHNPSRVIGKYLTVGEDDKGLKITGATTPGHSDAKDVAANLRFEAVSGLSIGGYTDEADMLEAGGRLIKVFDLYEISVVSMPAEDEARIDSGTVKELIDQCGKLSDMEEVLRDLGFSRTMAKAFTARMRRLVKEDEGVSERKQESVLDLIRTIQGAKV